MRARQPPACGRGVPRVMHVHVTAGAQMWAPVSVPALSCSPTLSRLRAPNCCARLFQVSARVFVAACGTGMGEAERARKRESLEMGSGVKGSRPGCRYRWRWGKWLREPSGRWGEGGESGHVQVPLSPHLLLAALGPFWSRRR